MKNVDRLIPITLYTKENCGLCDEAKALLETFAPQYPYRLTEVDITQDEALFERFRYEIPVFEMGGVTVKAPIGVEDFRDAFEKVG